MNKFAYIIKFLPISLVIFLALLIRIEYHQKTYIYHPLSGDAYWYVIYSKNLEQHSTFSKQDDTEKPVPDSYWAPGYPTFIMLSNQLAKLLDINSYSMLMASQILIGVLIVLLTYMIGVHFLQRYFALTAAVLAALSPHLISLGNYILTETLFSFFLLLSIYLFIRMIDHMRWYFGILAGIAFGVAYLVNPVIFFAPIFLIALCYSYLKKIKNMPEIKILLSYMLISFMAITIAWSARNYISVTDSQQSTASRAFANLIIGSHRNYYDLWRANPRDENNPATLDQAAAQGSISSFLSVLFERIKHNPTDYAKWYFIEKPINLWSWSIFIGQGDIYVYDVAYSLYDRSRLALASYSIMKSLHWWLFMFAMLGLFFIFRTRLDYKNTVAITIYTTTIYISAVYVLLQADSRYSIPLRPEMYLCAMFFVENLIGIAKSARQKESRAT